MKENGRIARAAGIGWPIVLVKPAPNRKAVKICPDWPTNPGMVAKYLLPVLESRWPYVTFSRGTSRDNPAEGLWSVHEDICDAEALVGIDADTWHEAVIAAVLATGETPNE